MRRAAARSARHAPRDTRARVLRARQLPLPLRLLIYHDADVFSPTLSCLARRRLFSRCAAMPLRRHYLAARILLLALPSMPPC